MKLLSMSVCIHERSNIHKKKKTLFECYVSQVIEEYKSMLMM